MSFVIRLQNLEWSANSADIRHFFRGLEIPKGGVHIIGGEKGIAFITFATEKDALMAMEKDGLRLNGNYVTLQLSSQMELDDVVVEIPNKSARMELPEKYPCDDMRWSPSFKQSRSHHKRSTERLKYSPPPRNARSHSRSHPRGRPHTFSYKSDRSSRRTSHSPIMSEERLSKYPDESRLELQMEGRSPEHEAVETTDLYDRHSPSPSHDLGLFIEDIELKKFSMMNHEYPLSYEYKNKFVHSEKFDVYHTRKDESPECLYPKHDEENISVACSERIGVCHTRTNEPLERFYPKHDGNKIDFAHSEQIDVWHTRKDKPPECLYPKYDEEKINFAHSEQIDVCRTRMNEPMESLYSKCDKKNFANSVWIDVFHTREDERPESLYPKHEGNAVLKFKHHTDVNSPNVPAFQKDSNSPLPISFQDDRNNSDNFCIQLSGLSPTADIKDIQFIFKSYFVPPHNVKWDKNSRDCQSRIAYVKISNKEDFNEIILCNNIDFRGRKISITKCPDAIFYDLITSGCFRSKENKRRQRRISRWSKEFCYILKGLPYSANEYDVLNFFTGLNLLDLLILYDQDGKATGTGYVQFLSEEDYRKAYQKNGKKIGYRFIEIFECNAADIRHAKIAANGVSKAINDILNEHMFKNRSLLFKQNLPQKRPLCIVVSGLPQLVTTADIFAFFQESDIHPNAVHIILNENLSPSGRAFIEFLDFFDLDVALKQQGKLLGQKAISVKQVLFDEMVKIIEMNPVQHDFGVIQKYHYKPNEGFVDESVPEKLPYIWEPLEDVNQEPSYCPVWQNDMTKLQESFHSSENCLKRKSPFPGEEYFNLSNRPEYSRFGHQEKTDKKESMNQFRQKSERYFNSLPTKQSYRNQRDFNQFNSTFNAEETNMINSPKVRHAFGFAKSFTTSHKNMEQPDETEMDKDRRPIKFGVKSTKGQQSVSTNEKLKETFDSSNSKVERVQLKKLSPEIKENAPKNEDIKNNKSKSSKDNGSSKNSSKTFTGKEIQSSDRRSSGKSSQLRETSNRRYRRSTSHENAVSKVGSSHKRGHYENNRQTKTFVSTPCPRDDNYAGELEPKSCTVHVSNVPLHCGIQDIFDFFRGFSIRGENVIRRYTDNGLPTGDVRITFENARDAKNVATLLNGCRMQGNLISLILV